MPIIANNIVTTNNKKEEVRPELPPITPLEKVSVVPRAIHDREHHHGVVIVDGKERKISKHSQYLLDMLSIDND